MTQCQKIVAYLRKNKSISPMEAVRDLKCYRLAARISDLRGMGYKILTKTEKSQDGGMYARYFLREQ